MSGAVSPSGLKRPGDSGPEMDGLRKEADLALDCWAREAGAAVGERGATSSLPSSEAAGLSSAAALVSGSTSGVGGGFVSGSSFFSAEAPALDLFFFFSSWA